MVLTMRRIIQKILNEELSDNKKKFFKKLWDEEKKEKGYAIWDEKKLIRFGVNEKNKNEIWKYYTEWVGGEDRFREFENYIEGREFDSKNIPYFKTDYPLTHFKFILYDIHVTYTKKVVGKYDITWGFTQEFEEIQVNIQTNNNEIEDMMNYFEFQDYIKNGLYNFIELLGYSFGFIIKGPIILTEKKLD